MSETPPFIADLPGGRRALPDRDRSFACKPSGAMLPGYIADRLCGMVVRGGMTDNKCNVYYVDIFDVDRFLEGVGDHAASVYYTKIILRPTPTGGSLP
jgi:hypothetical protein